MKTLHLSCHEFGCKKKKTHCACYWACRRHFSFLTSCLLSEISSVCLTLSCVNLCTWQKDKEDLTMEYAAETEVRERASSFCGNKVLRPHPRQGSHIRRPNL